MKLSEMNLRIWLPPTAGVCALLAATGIALSTHARAQQDVVDLETLADSLEQKAIIGAATVTAANEIDELGREREALEQRMAEALRPALVEVELSGSARKAGLNVLDAQPIRTGGRTSNEEDSVELPRYRILVEGEYRQIAEFMRLCIDQRLPARVAELRVTGAPADPNLLHSEIIMEVFRPTSAAGDSSTSGIQTGTNQG